MSEQKFSFESDVESIHISKEYVLVGMKDGSVACISLKDEEIKWTNKFSHNIPITATLIQKNGNDETLFLAGNNEGQLVVMNEKGKTLSLKQCKRSAIFGLLDLGYPYIVVYFPGGNEEYALHKNGDEGCSLQKVYGCTNSGNYSIKRDIEVEEDFKWQILKGREEGLYPIERYNCMSSAKTNRTIGLQLCKHKDVLFAYASPLESQECTKKFWEDDDKIKKFPIFDLSGDISHYIRFDSHVKNVINNTWYTKEGKLELECLYFLLENGDLHRFSWEKLAKPEKGMILTDETRQVIDSNGDGRKITSADLHDSKICLVFNYRFMEILPNKPIQTENHESQTDNSSETTTDEEKLRLETNDSIDNSLEIQEDIDNLMLGPNN